MLVNWNLLVSAVKLVSFERVTCSFVGVTCSFVGVTCSFVGVTCSFDSIAFALWFQNDEYCNTYTVSKIQLKRWGWGKFCELSRQICFDFAYYFILILYLSNCLIRCVFCHFRTFPWLLKKICKIKTNLSEIHKALPPPPPISSTEFPPLYMCCNIHHFGITKRKVVASTLQVTPTKLQVTPTKLQVTRSKTTKFQLTNMLFITC